MQRKGLVAKKQKQPESAPGSDDTTPAAPPGASFDTEEGRAAHGMRKDLGPEGEPESENEKDHDPEESDDHEAP
jgi:hypothetical protein